MLPSMAAFEKNVRRFGGFAAFGWDSEGSMDGGSVDGEDTAAAAAVVDAGRIIAGDVVINPGQSRVCSCN